MPELPEVETIKTAVESAVGNCIILNIAINNNRFREEIPADLPEKAKGARIIAWRRIAKYIIIDLDNGFSLIWHMGMSGKVKICPEPPARLEKHDHVLIMTERACLVFNDPRRFGLLTYCLSAKLAQHHLLARLGPDPLSDTFSAQYLHQELQKRKTPVKTALLDAKIVTGIGNIYASEILYQAGVSPLRSGASLSVEECRRIVSAGREVLSKAIAAGGSTLRDYARPDGKLGYFQFQHCVYNKTGQSCPDCSCQINQTGGIKRIVLGGRSTFYCPVKQK